MESKKVGKPGKKATDDVDLHVYRLKQCYKNLLTVLEYTHFMNADLEHCHNIIRGYIPQTLLCGPESNQISGCQKISSAKRSGYQVMHV